MDGWTKKTKGNAKIYTHPLVHDGHAIVQNHWGVAFNGQKFDTVAAAKEFALSQVAE